MCSLHPYATASGNPYLGKMFLVYHVRLVRARSNVRNRFRPGALPFHRLFERELVRLLKLPTMASINQFATPSAATVASH